MIEGLILLIELALLALLLLAVLRSSRPGAKQDLGLFSYKSESDQSTPPATKQKRPQRGGHA